MSASLGEQLKAAREAQSITLREVSEQTRISLRYLEALEANDFGVLPGGVFNRSFVRTYAKYIGFDEHEALRLYQETSNTPASEEEKPLSLPRHKVYTDENVARPPLVNLLLVGGALLLLAAGIYGFLRWYNRQPAAPSVAGTATPTPALPAATPAATLTAPSSSPVAGASPGASPSFISAPPPTPPPAGSFAIQVRARDKAVQVALGADGEKLQTIILKPGEARDFTPNNELKIEYTEPGGDLLEIYVNGQPINMPKDYRPAGKLRIVSFVLGRNSYQSRLPGAAPVATPTPQ